MYFKRKRQMANNIYIYICVCVIRRYRSNATLSLIHNFTHSTVWSSTVLLSFSRPSALRYSRGGGDALHSLSRCTIYTLIQTMT